MSRQSREWPLECMVYQEGGDDFGGKLVCWNSFLGYDDKLYPTDLEEMFPNAHSALVEWAAKVSNVEVQPTALVPKVGFQHDWSRGGYELYHDLLVGQLLGTAKQLRFGAVRRLNRKPFKNRKTDNKVGRFSVQAQATPFILHTLAYLSRRIVTSDRFRMQLRVRDFISARIELMSTATLFMLLNGCASVSNPGKTQNTYACVSGFIKQKVRQVGGPDKHAKVVVLGMHGEGNLEIGFQSKTFVVPRHYVKISKFSVTFKCGQTGAYERVVLRADQCKTKCNSSLDKAMKKLGRDAGHGMIAFLPLSFSGWEPAYIAHDN